MTRILQLVFVLAAFVATAAVYHRLPDPMPIHFDLHGRVDDTMRLPWGAIFSPIMMTVLAAVFALARRSVVARRGGSAAGVLDLMALATQAFLLELHVVVLRFALGHDIDVARAATGGVGLLFAVMGNWFGKLPRNHMVGIRLPRTLADDETWLMTHRFAGRVFVVGGLLVGSAALCAAPPIVLLVGLLAMIALPVVYAYTFAGGST